MCLVRAAKRSRILGPAHVTTTMPERSERRKKPRKPTPVGEAIEFDFSSGGGKTRRLSARLIDISDFGCGIETKEPLTVGADLKTFHVPAPNFSNTDGTIDAQVVHCRLHDEGIYRSGLAFEAAHARTARKIEGDPSLTDYYEALQISPNANLDTIQRVYRMMAQRFHPDNTETGNQAAFQLILQAYRVLSDPEKRAEYDAQHRAATEVRWRIFDKPESSSGSGIEEEQKKRWAILSALYMKRKNAPEKPGMRIRDLGDLLACPTEHLLFALWYLRGKSLIVTEDQGFIAITPEGADDLEQASPDVLPNMPKMIEAAAKTDGDA